MPRSVTLNVSIRVIYRSTVSSARERVLTSAGELLRAGGRPAVGDITAAAGISRATFYRTFGSRAGLLRELGLDPEPDVRMMVLEAAAGLLERDGLAMLSMEELAAAAGLSRAGLYRLFPGKAALFSALVDAFSPIDTVIATIAKHREGPPEEVMPEVAVAVLRTVSAHFGVIRPLLFEVSSLGPDVREKVVGDVAPRLLAALGGYLLEQMDAGLVRRVHPLLAIQAFVGPIMVHLLMRRVVSEGLGMSLDSEAVVRELAAVWVRGMAPAREF